MFVGCLSLLRWKCRYMEKSLSYFTLASSYESGNRQRENINLGKSSRNSWVFGCLGSSGLCYKCTSDSPAEGCSVPSFTSSHPHGEGHAVNCSAEHPMASGKSIPDLPHSLGSAAQYQILKAWPQGFCKRFSQARMKISCIQFF